MPRSVGRLTGALEPGGEVGHELQVIRGGHDYVACAGQAAGGGFTTEGNCFTQVRPTPTPARTIAALLTIGPADLNPRRFVSRHLLDDELDPRPALARRTKPTARSERDSRPSAPGPTATPAADTQGGSSAEPPPYDADAT